MPATRWRRSGSPPSFSTASVTKTIVLAEGRYMVERIPAAEMVELPGVDQGWWVDSGQIVREVEPFLQGIWEPGEWDVVDTNRILATVLFTDIAGSTAKLAELGDRRWKESAPAAPWTGQAAAPSVLRPGDRNRRGWLLRQLRRAR